MCITLTVRVRCMLVARNDFATSTKHIVDVIDHTLVEEAQ